MTKWRGLLTTEITYKDIMLKWTITFVVLTIIIAIFGFGGVSSAMATIAKVLFFVFLALVIISFLKGRTNKV